MQRPIQVKRDLENEDEMWSQNDEAYVASDESLAMAERYEVLCRSCKTSFAPGTKLCVHCGRKIGSSFSTGFQSSNELADESLPRKTPGRKAVWILTAIVALAGSIMRTCY